MDELTKKLDELQITHDVGHIDSLISKLKQSSYISTGTRNRVVRLIRHEPRTSSLTGLETIFSQSASHCIPRAVVREVITLLNEIKQRHSNSSEDRTSWVKEEWFCLLVDSDELIKPFRNLLNDVCVCRHNVMSSLFIIVLFGELSEAEFYTRFLAACPIQDYLVGMTEMKARSIFKYYGGVSIGGSSECAHLMAGNDTQSVHVDALVLSF